jgi:hypothetical protein
MSLIAYLEAIAGGWTILAVLGSAGWAVVIRRSRHRGPVRMTELPPVPPSDASWLPVWPSGSDLIAHDAVPESSPELEQERIDRTCAEILAIEGLYVRGEAA